MSGELATKPHVVCMPWPSQGHLNAMLNVAKLLHSKGFHITYVLAELNAQLIAASDCADSLIGLPDFRFALLPCPDGLFKDIPSLCQFNRANCLGPFRRLLVGLEGPPVTCVVYDVATSFSLQAAKELGVPSVVLCPTSAASFFSVVYFKQLIEMGLVPLKDENDLSNGYLDVTRIDWIPGLKDFRLKDFPSFIRTTDPNDIILNFMTDEGQNALQANALIANTFDDLERPVLEAMSKILPPVYAIGPLSLLSRYISHGPLASIRMSMWKEEPACVEWLNARRPGSVVYVNFGSVTILSNEQLVEFAWGLADSGHDFLWVIRSDLVAGGMGVLPPEFLTATNDHSLLVSWCPQETVLKHEAMGGFLTHCGWNSIMESIGEGVPMVCWPFFADQPTNCKYVCGEWGIGLEIGGEVRRKEVAAKVREMMEGEKGKEMRRRAEEWKAAAVAAAGAGGSSFESFERMVSDVLAGARK